MTELNAARHVPHDELELLPGKVTADRGELRQLSGSDYGLATSVMYARVAPGSGPRRHQHPHTEIFVIHGGQARFEVEGAYVEAEAGDMVIVPPTPGTPSSTPAPRSFARPASTRTRVRSPSSRTGPAATEPMRQRKIPQ